MGQIRRKGIGQILVSLLLCLELAVLAGCGNWLDSGTETEKSGTGKSDAEKSEVVKDENLIVVGVSQIGSESMWRTANTQSIQNVFTQENGYFLIFDNARQKQENQIKAIRSFVSQQVDYIVFSPIEESGWDTVLQEAKDAGIPVILMDRSVDVADTSLYTAWVGSDFEKEGENAGLWLADYLEEQGRDDEEINIVVLQGTAGGTSTIGRTVGFDSVAADHDNWKILEQTDAEFTTAKGQEEMETMLRKYEKIDVVVSQNDDMTFGALEAIRKAGKSAGVDGDIIMISFDAVKSALKLVEAGVIHVDIECNPEQGEYIEKVIRALENGESVEKINYVPEKIFTQKNVSQFIDERTY